MDGRRWRQVLGLGLGACAVLPLLGDAAPLGVALVGVAALVVAVVGIRHWSTRRSAWWLVVVGAGLHLLGGIVHGIVAEVTGVDDPYPSIADGIFLAGYAAMIVGSYRFVKFRSGRAEREHFLDALIVAIGATVVTWAVLLAPYVRDGTIPWGERLVSICYSSVLLGLLAMITRIAVGPGARNPSYYLLAGSVAFVFLIDTIATLQTTTALSIDVVTNLAAVPYVLFGAAALHPSMAGITDPPAETDVPLTGRRQLLLGAALLVPSLVIVWNTARSEAIDVPVLLAGSVTLTVLVIARLAALVRARERRANHEAVLRRAGAALVTATSRDAILDGTLRAVESLVEPAAAMRASVLLRSEHEFQVVASVGDAAEVAEGTTLASEDADAVLQEAVESRRAIAFSGRRPIDLPASAPAPAVHHGLLVPLVSQNEVRGVIAVSASTPLARTTRFDLERLAGQVALALESAALTEDLLRRRSERRFRSLVQSSSDLVMVVNDGKIVFASPAAERLLGRDEESLRSLRPEELVHPEDQSAATDVLAAPNATDGSTDPVELRFRHFDGSYRWFEMLARDLRSDPDIDGIVVNAREITDRKRAEQRVARSEARFRSLVQNSSDVVAVIDEAAFFTYVSPSVGKMLGYRPDELVGTSALSLLPREEAEKALGLLRQLGREAFGQLSQEIRLLDHVGGWHTLDVTMTDLREQPAVGGIVLNARDVTDRKELEESLRQQALSDALTGLGNRTMFATAVEAAVETAGPGQLAAVLFIDLDDFKTVNDSLGHSVGDELLVLVADRLRQHLRGADVAARLGGDEFAVLVTEIADEQEALDVAQRIMDALRLPYDVEGREIGITTSIGVALADQPETSAPVLLRNADMAMYMAKERGKQRAEVFQEEMHASVFERLELKTDLARGIDEDQLVLHYQPIVSLKTGEIVEVEALVRWEHPTRGLLSPDMFIPLAEDTGLILPLGRWVLNEACRQLQQWQRDLPSDHAPRMSVNVSVRQLADGVIVDDVAVALRRTGIDPRMLDLELTESLLTSDEGEMLDALRELKALGVSVSVDDFGTGYSSLSYLQKYPVDALKIDRSFVDPLGRETNAEGVVRSIIELASSLGLETVAEGIEGAEQLEMLRNLGCAFGQGYYFARPLPAADVVHLFGAERDEPGVLPLASSNGARKAG